MNLGVGEGELERIFWCVIFFLPSEFEGIRGEFRGDLCCAAVQRAITASRANHICTRFGKKLVWGVSSVCGCGGGDGGGGYGQPAEIPCME